MTFTSIGRRIGIAAAAIQVAKNRIFGSPSTVEPVISISVNQNREGDIFVIENHSDSPAYDLQIDPIEFKELKATFRAIPVVSSRHPMDVVAEVSYAKGEVCYDNPSLSVGPLSKRKHNVSDVLFHLWGALDTNTRIYTHPLIVKYRSKDGWNFKISADLVLLVPSRRLFVKGIKVN